MAICLSKKRKDAWPIKEVELIHTDFQKLNTNQKSYDTGLIYAYQADDGGIYKTIELSLIGNCDSRKLGVTINTPYYYGFIRIDNACGYCQFMFHSLKELFEHHLKSNHKHNEIYVFKRQKRFFEWCISRPIQYPKYKGYSLDENP